MSASGLVTSEAGAYTDVLTHTIGFFVVEVPIHFHDVPVFTGSREHCVDAHASHMFRPLEFGGRCPRTPP
jgi:hypothetical protein